MINLHIEVEAPDPDLLRADCEKFATIYCSSIARQGARKISEKIRDVLGDYYGEYDPVLYKRTGSLFEDPYQIILEDDTGGVVAHGDSMYHPVRGVDEGMIFDWSFMHGYHGFGGFGNKPIAAGASPNEKMEEWINSPALQNEVSEEAENEAKSAGYVYLSF